jgi:indolepyruvate ferredoxin oxidoreductase alpha subunit
MEHKKTAIDAITSGVMNGHAIISVGFPDHPIDKILNALNISKNNSQNPIHIEASINEKVGFEIAMGASMCYGRSILFIKHTGLNIAADSFMTGCYAGALGGLVIVYVDDPALQYSQNAHDNRVYGLHGLIPIWEPSSLKELRDMIIYGFEFSEKYETLLLVRTSLSLFDLQESFTEIPIEEFDRQYEFDNAQRARWTHLPTNARVNRIKLLERMKKITQNIVDFSFNLSNIQSDAKIGIISTGYTYQRAQNVLSQVKLQNAISWFKLGMSFPLPEAKILEFLQNHETVIIIEELEPIIELKVKNIAFNHHLTTKIVGKEYFPESNELIPPIIADGLKQILNVKIPKDFDEKLNREKPSLPSKEIQNQIQLFFTTLTQIEHDLNIPIINEADLDLEPFNTSLKMDAFIGRGASAGFANGIVKLDSNPNIAFMSLQSFLHSGISALINAIYNENLFLAIIVDYGVRHFLEQQIDLPLILDGIGLSSNQIWTGDLRNISEFQQSFKSALQASGVRVFIPLIQTKEMH